MRRVFKLRLALATAVLTSAVAGADCVSTVAQISSRGVLPNRSAAATAWTGTIFGTSKVERSIQNPIYFATYNEDFVQLTGDRRVADSSLAGPLALLWNGSDFGLFYQNSSSQLMLQRVSASGESVGTPVAIGAQYAALRDREYDVVWDPTRQAYLVLFTVTSGAGRGIHVTVIGREGAERETLWLTTIASPISRPQIAVTSDGSIAVAFHVPGTDAIRFVTLNQSLQISNTTVALAAAQEIELGTDGTNFIVVGTVRVTTTSEIRWMILSRTGEVVRSEGSLVKGTGADIAPVQIYWNAERQELALLYLDSFFGFNVLPGQLRLRRFTATGERLSDSPFSPEPITSTFGSIYPISWTGKSYLGSLTSDLSAQHTDSHIVRHCPLIVTPTADKRILKAGELLTFTAVTSGGTPEFSYTWNFGDTPRSEVGNNLLHRYEKNGTYTVTVRAVDALGATSVGTMTVEVGATVRRRAVKR